jgi:hypothetical protein
MVIVSSHSIGPAQQRLRVSYRNNVRVDGHHFHMIRKESGRCIGELHLMTMRAL